MAQDMDVDAEPSTSYPTEGPFRLKHVCRGQHNKAVSNLRFSPSGNLLASVSADSTLKIWSVADGTLHQPAATANGGAPSSKAGAAQQQQHTGGLNDVAWNPSGTLLATASDDMTAKIWDLETRSCLSTFAGHTHYVFCCQFNPWGNILTTSSFDETLRFWDVRSGRCIRELPAHSDPITGMDFSYDGTVLASCSFDGLLRLWDTQTGRCLRTTAIDNGAQPLSCVSFSPNGVYLLQSSLDSCVRLIAYDSGKVAKTYRGHTNTKFCSTSCFLPHLPSGVAAAAAGSEDGSIFVWDLNSKQVMQQIPPAQQGVEPGGPGHSAAVLCVAAHPSLPLMASGGHDADCTIQLWSAEGSS